MYMAKAEPSAPREVVSEAPASDTSAVTESAPQVQQGTLVSLVDEFHGQGGTFLLDPATGIRTLVERTEPASL